MILSFTRALALVVLTTSIVVSPAAKAYGGFASSSAEPVRTTGEQIVFVDTPGPGMTAILRTLVTPGVSPFAWLIPARKKPKLAPSSSTVFQRLADATAPEYLLEIASDGQCRTDAPEDAAHPSTATSPELELAPDTVHATWIDAGHGEIAEAVIRELQPASAPRDVIEQYAKEGYGFLVLRVSAAANAAYVRPIAVTYEAERPLVPMRLLRGIADDFSLRVWVFGPSQAVPSGSPSLVLNDARIDWQSAVTYRTGTLPANGAGLSGPEVRAPANYDALVSAAVAEAGGSGFVTELGAPASQFRQAIWSQTDQERLTELSGHRYRDGIEAVIAAREVYGGWGGFADAVRSASSLPAELSPLAFALEPERYRGSVKVDGPRFLRSLRELVVHPVIEASELLLKAPYLTRLYSRLGATATKSDLAFDYNADLALVPKAHLARRLLRCAPDTASKDAPWTIALPHGGVAAGRGPGVPPDLASLPANLEVVTLSAHGPGSVVKDNRAAVGARLVVPGTNDAELDRAHPPRTGALIGGDQTVTPETPLPAPSSQSPLSQTKNHGCDISDAESGRSPAAILATALMAAAFVRRRCRRKNWDAMFWLSCAVLPSCKHAAHTEAGAPSAAAPQPSVAAQIAPVDPEELLTRERLKDPKTCKPCHAMHYREWSSSMHAYATIDPVFIAMNARGQRETGGKLGDFCFKCHAPMAVQAGLVKSDTDPSKLPDEARGVTCYFCHNVNAIEGDHNGMLRIAGDSTMRGPIKDPARVTAHKAEFSEYFDEYGPKSSQMCGSCHDVVTPKGVHLERTFEEYRHGIFSKSATGAPPAFDSCVGCHMGGEPGFAASGNGMPSRTVHKHLWPGIDVAVTDFPHKDAMRSAVERCELPRSVSFFTLEVTPPDLFTFQMETNAGHNQPSGAAQDRRMWLEVSAYDEAGKRLDGASSGVIADDEIEERPESDPRHDPNLLLLSDRMFDAKGQAAHMFWEAERSSLHPTGFESGVLPAANTTYVSGRHAVLKQYRLSGSEGRLPARVTARLRMRPIGFDVLRDLVRTGDLDPSVLAQMPTFDFGHRIDWTPDQGVMKPIFATLATADCDDFRCLLEPGSKHCKRSPSPPESGPAAKKRAASGVERY